MVYPEPTNLENRNLQTTQTLAIHPKVLDKGE